MEKQIKPVDVLVADALDPETTHLFVALEEEGYKGNRVLCPICRKTVDARSAKNHYLTQHANSQTSGGTGKRQLDIVEQLPSKTTRRKLNQEGQQNSDILQSLCGPLPLTLVKATTQTMQVYPYKLTPVEETNDAAGVGLFLRRESESYARATLGPGFRLTKINMESLAQIPLFDDDLLTTHEEVTEEHLLAIESGGLIGMERLVGAVLATGVDTFRILCVEKYSRDVLADPHAEPMFAAPSSVPTTGFSTQYRGRLKIVTLADKFGRSRLVLGVRACNYLLTLGSFNGKVKMGPTNCAEFPVQDSTALLIQRQRQDPNALKDDILGLAQIRSHFGHAATYTTRRAALNGFSSISQMPATIFTISQWPVAHSRVFYQLWKRSREPGQGVVLQLDDVDEPDASDRKESAQICRDLRLLFDAAGSLSIHKSAEAEALLSRLANYFSSAISEKNQIIARKILE